eukprot:19394-Pelagomonas_calceolata.AAC.1
MHARTHARALPVFRVACNATPCHYASSIVCPWVAVVPKTAFLPGLLSVVKGKRPFSVSLQERSWVVARSYLSPPHLYRTGAAHFTYSLLL